MTAAVDDALHCPLCEYDLRGLIDPRCPECGYTFDWDELRDPTRRLHPYLFEHHPEANVRSFRRTLYASFLPRRFWRQLHAMQAARRRRMITYWIIVALLCLLPALLYWLYMTAAVDATNQLARTRQAMLLSQADHDRLANEFGSFEHYLDIAWPLLPSWRVPWNALNMYGMRPVILVALTILAWPWLTMAALMIFRASMRKKQIKPIHVVRCVIYSADAMLLAAAVLAMWTAELTLSNSGSSYQYYVDSLIKLMLVALMLLLTYRLWIGYREYLRFEHALATVVSSQVIVALIIWKFGLDTEMLRW